MKEGCNRVCSQACLLRWSFSDAMDVAPYYGNGQSPEAVKL